MKALVVGGVGSMGQAAARDLIKQDQVEKVVLGDIVTDPSRLYERLRASEKVSVTKIDVNDHDALVKALKDVDVVINCAGPFHKTGVSVSKAAIEAKVNYVDISDEYKTVVNLFVPEIEERARQAGITILTGMGSDPGTNNLIAKYHASHLDSVDEIALFWVVSIADMEEGATSGAAWDHSLHMNTGSVPQYIDGRLEYVEAGTGEETVNFLEPLGSCPVRYVGHPQPLTMPRYMEGVKTVVIKGAMLPEWVDRLIQEQKETGFLNAEPLDVKGTKVTPYDLTLQLWRTIPQNRDPGPKASGMKVIVKGERDGKRVTYTSDIVGRTAPGTGIAASIAALMLCSGDINVKGVVAPEGCIDPEKYFAALLGRGAKIYQTETITSMLSV
ncbi:MAG: saccharopine dehydrogenase NADP-binding domain-containing protein [Deltaproteobacteria bacterium]|nr:saccharopine dehydrogenase NADP-binding domain-containing protein [Deltaproteobacteria bacterium]MBW2138000.1 saccharopine dehydrogenase NADP-binding domain-containing protein [Deltaproteobacteria bacterium]